MLLLNGGGGRGGIYESKNNLLTLYARKKQYDNSQMYKQKLVHSVGNGSQEI